MGKFLKYQVILSNLGDHKILNINYTIFPISEVFELLNFNSLCYNIVLTIYFLLD